MPAADPQRIAKLLARAGVASRREVERMIAEGRVAKDGVVLDTPATVLPSLKGVTVDGQPVEAPEPARLFLYHKPPGLLVTERDPGGRATIYDRLPPGLPRVVPVGRLDLSTEGLLLLTTDGGLKRQLELPATGVERAYRARAYGAITQAQLEELIEGVEIDGVRYGSINANLERRTGANVWIELILTEGKNREVRRVLEHLGLRVSRLIRTRYGPFVLGDLPPGEVGEVRRHDVESFRKHPTRLDLPQPARGRSGLAPVARAGASRGEADAKAGTPSRPPQRANGAATTSPPEPLRQGPGRGAGKLQRAPYQAERQPGDHRPAQLSQARQEEARRGRTASPATHPGRAARGERAADPAPSRVRSGRNEREGHPPRVQGAAERPVRPARPRVAEGGAPSTRTPAGTPQRSRTGGANSQPARTPDAQRPKPTNPARAARAKAHRDATGRPDPAPPKPGRSSPKRPGFPRPPRTRK